MTKFVKLEDAAALIRDGDLVAISGNMRMSPMSMVRQVIRQGTKNLRLLFSASCAINADLLIGAGRAASVEFPHLSLDEYGLAPNFRRMAEQGAIKTFDHV